MLQVILLFSLLIFAFFTGQDSIVITKIVGFIFICQILVEIKNKLK